MSSASFLLILLHGFVVLYKGFGKIVATVVFGYKIEVIGCGREKNGLNCLFARVGYWPRGKASDNIGIIGGALSQVLFLQVAAEILDTINYGGISFKAHLLF